MELMAFDTKLEMNNPSWTDKDFLEHQLLTDEIDLEPCKFLLKDERTCFYFCSAFNIFVDERRSVFFERRRKIGKMRERHLMLDEECHEIEVQPYSV